MADLGFMAIRITPSWIHLLIFYLLVIGLTVVVAIKTSVYGELDSEDTRKRMLKAALIAFSAGLVVWGVIVVSDWTIQSARLEESTRKQVLQNQEEMTILWRSVKSELEFKDSHAPIFTITIQTTELSR